MLAVVAAVGFAYFLVVELTTPQPLVNLRLFRQRNFAFGVLASGIGYGLFFGNVVLLPLWLQQWLGYTSTWAGLATAPVGLAAIALSPWVGRNVGRIDPRRLLTFSFLAFAWVMWLRSGFDTQVPFEVILVPIVLQGVAMPFFFIPLQTIIFNGIPPEQLPSASGLSNFVRITCGAVGTSLFTTLWEQRAALHHAHLVEMVHPGRPGAAQALERLGGGGPEPRAGAGPCAAPDRPAGLHDGGDRPVPAVVGAVHRADRRGLADAAAPGGRTCGHGRRGRVTMVATGRPAMEQCGAPSPHRPPCRTRPCPTCC